MERNTIDYLKLFEAHCIYDKTIGLKLQVSPEGDITYFLNVQKKHLSSPNSCHGAVIAGMMDATLGLVALGRAFSLNLVCATVEFKINYFAPALLGDKLMGRGHVDHQGKRLIFTSAEIINMKNDKVIAKGLGTFNLYPLEKKIRTTQRGNIDFIPQSDS